MEFPIAIHKDEDSVYGVIVPDIPGCHSFGNSINDAIRNAREAIYGHVQTLLELGSPAVFSASVIDDLASREEYSGAIWALVSIDWSALDPKPERVNISLPKFVLRRIDEYTKHHHETRSGFLARAALKELSQG